MKCEEFQSLLSDYIDGEISMEAGKLAAAHLAGCQDCQALLNTTQKTLHLARRQADAHLSPSFQAGLIRKVQAAFAARRGIKEADR